MEELWMQPSHNTKQILMMASRVLAMKKVLSHIQSVIIVLCTVCTFMAVELPNKTTN